MNTDPLVVPVKITADTAGGKEAVSSIDDINQATKQANKATAATAPAAKSSAAALNELGEASEKGAAAGRVLSAAASGNILSLGQLGPILKGLSTFLKGNLVGVLITVGALAANFLLPLIKGFMDAKSKAEDTDKALKDAADRADALNKAKLDSLDAQLAGISQRAQDLLSEFDAVQKAASDLDDAERSLAKAKLAARTDITEEQRVREGAAIDTRFDARRRGRALDTAQAQVTVAGTARNETQGEETDAAEAFRKAKAERDRTRSAVDNFDANFAKEEPERQNRITKQIDYWREQRIQNDSDPIARKQANDQIGKLEQESDISKDTRRKMALGAADTAAKDFIAAQAALDRTNKAALDAAAAFDKATAAFERAKDTQQKLATIEPETRRIQTEQAAAAAKQADIAAGRFPVTPTPAAAEPTRPVVTNTARPVNPNDPRDTFANAAAAAGAQASGAASSAANNANNPPGLQILAGEATKLANQLTKDPTTETLTKAAAVLAQLSAAMADSNAANAAEIAAVNKKLDSLLGKTQARGR